MLHVKAINPPFRNNPPFSPSLPCLEKIFHPCAYCQIRGSQTPLALLYIGTGEGLNYVFLDDNIPEQKVVSKVFAREGSSCTSNIERPYFSSGKFTKICMICGKSRNLHPDGKINFLHCR